MKFSSTVVTAIFAALVSGQGKVPGNNPLTFCAHNGNVVQMTNVTFDPNPPVKGQKLTITANGTSSKPIAQGAYINLKVKYGIFEVLDEKMDICRTAKEQLAVSCPVDSLSIVKELEIPGSLPSGGYRFKADAYDKRDYSLTCLEARFDL